MGLRVDSQIERQSTPRFRNNERLLASSAQFCTALIQYNIASELGLYISATGFALGSGFLTASWVVANKEVLRSRLADISYRKLLNGSRTPELTAPKSESLSQGTTRVAAGSFPEPFSGPKR